MTQDDRPFCQDCGARSDLGNKCRPCYAKWSRYLWADIPRELAKLREVTARLLAQPMRKAVASAALGVSSGKALSGALAELVTDLKRCIEGPYGEQLLAKLQAMHNAPDEKGRKAAVAEVD